MLCVADYLDALAWIDSIGGLSAAIARSEANLAIIEEFVEKTLLVELLSAKTQPRCPTRAFASLWARVQSRSKRSLKLLETEKCCASISVRIRDAPPGLRVWCGATVEKQGRRVIGRVAGIGLRGCRQ